MTGLPIRMRAPQVCEVLQCSRDHLYRLDKRGRLRKYNETSRLVFWLRDEVLAYARGEDPYAGNDAGNNGEYCHA